MCILTRLAVAGYIVVLSLALLAGRWPLQGPLLLTVVEGHGLHAGDVIVLVTSAGMAAAVLAAKP